MSIQLKNSPTFAIPVFFHFTAVCLADFTRKNVLNPIQMGLVFKRRWNNVILQQDVCNSHGIRNLSKLVEVEGVARFMHHRLLTVY